ncbi:MAG: head maturation protease, ClpP-related, partial [Bacteroidota bacterium]
SLFNAFVNHPAGVTVRIESLAASIASVIAMGGKKVESYQNSMIMIHNAWVLAMGDQNTFREIIDLLEKIDGNLLDIYTGKTKSGKKEMKQMMADETWMTATEAKDKGFIDTIIPSGKAAKAQFDLSIFAHVPDDLMLEGNQEPTIRDLEKALRDAGLSKNSAKAILARGWKAGNADEEIFAAAQRTLNILNGGN